MDMAPEYLKIDKSHVDALLDQGTITTTAYNMLLGNKTEHEEEDP